MMKKRAPTLIKSPLTWHLADAPVAPPLVPALAERGGTQLKTPRANIIVDTREQNPFDFSRFEGWFSAFEKKPLKLGDYAVAGLESLCVVERKDLPDLVHSFTVERSVFLKRIKLMSSYPHRHSTAESNQNTLPSFCCESKPYFSVTDCTPGWTQPPIPVHR
jgi:hypothetical protein